MNKVLVRIAARNVLRHGKRTIITALVLTAGIGMFIFFDSILAGMDRMTIDSMVDFSESSLALMSQDYKEEGRALPIEPRYGIPDSTGVEARLRQLLPDLQALTPRTQFAAFASNRVDSIPVVGTAVVPRSDAQVFGIAANIEKGAWLGEEEGQIVIGASLGRDLGVGVGDWLILSARAVDDSLNADEFLIVGLVNVPAQEISQSGIFMSFDSAKALLGENLPVTGLFASLPRARTLDLELNASAKAAEAVSKAFPNLASRPIKEAAGDYLAMRNMKAKYSSLIILVVLLIAGVGIVNTILMSVYSRVKEIGILRAYGMRPANIKRLFSLEGMFIGLVGSLGGVALGCLGVWASIRWGIPLDKMMGNLDMGGIPIGGALRGEWHISTIMMGFIFGVLASWASARIPSSKAGKLEITDALRFV
jgi:putative ABC transport system permease protein